MSDNTENTQEVKEKTQQEPVYTEIQLKAIEQGWIPKEEFDGDESEFIDAPEFVRRGELFRKIEHQSKELRAVRQALDAFQKHHSKVKEMEYERALRTLKEARRTAMKEGETEQALALEEKIEEVQAEKQQIVKESQATLQVEDDSYSPKFQEWVERNPWYETNRVMRRTADALGKDLVDEGYTPEQVLDMVEKEMRKEFKHKFENPNTRRAPAVEGSTRTGSTSKDTFVLTPEERDIMKKIVAVTPGFTEEKYIEELKALRNKE